MDKENDYIPVIHFCYYLVILLHRLLIETTSVNFNTHYACLVHCNHHQEINPEKCNTTILE